MVPASQSPSSYTSQTTKGMYQRLSGRNTGLVPASQKPFVYTSRNTVYVSEIVWEKYRFGTGFSEPFVIHFPYSKGMFRDYK